ncbi:Dabb family protein [Orrella daihaiensis]|uniref:Dabb family protein n=1 Tax=Orrella daihaiensis TaxID=2782176 RepID=A0ABY4AMC1_9BURK|nr:Dabb family protein [Orrella daihaiensis]UOD51465.1 Dabb family protein [Orrella daihaiensis]
MSQSRSINTGELNTRAESLTASNYRVGIIRHIVLFKFKDGIPESIKQSVAQRFLSMLNDAKRDGGAYIISIEYGSQISQEAFGLDFEQGYIVTFRSEGDRNYYVGEPFIRDPAHYDPVHHAFKAFVGPLLDKDAGCLVFDFKPNS